MIMSNNIIVLLTNQKPILFEEAQAHKHSSEIFD